MGHLQVFEMENSIGDIFFRTSNSYGRKDHLCILQTVCTWNFNISIQSIQG